MRLSVSVAALVTGGVAGAASADPLLPSGGQIVAGQAAIRLPAAGQMVIDQTSSRAVIDWRGFSIGAGGVVQFNNGTGATLNRVLGGDPSSIAGQLRAAGSVYLVNPAGVVVDSSGHVLTGGSFVASTRSIGADAFMAGGSLTFVGNGSGGVENRGRIETGGDAVLIGHWVTNTGSIRAGGAAGLAAGSRVVLQAAGSDARIYVEGTSGDVTTSGAVTAAAAELKAAGGNVYALAGNSGVVRATGVASEGGRILLTAGGDVTVASNATLTADGGSISVDAGKALTVSGRIAANAGADNAGGGRITLLAQDIALTGADIAASGSGNGSGGIVRIGGGRLGGEGLREAATLKADAATTITADGGASGNGGDVVLWSRDWTGFAGTILARGGALAGNGGEAEVSSRGILGYDGLTDLRAANGSTGTLLLDPYNITISTAASSNVSGLTPTGNDSNINATTLTNALTTANVTVSTGLAGSPGSQAGNITVSAPLSWAANQLTLQAAGTITINASISGGSAASLALSSGITSGSTTAIGGSGQIALPNLLTVTAGGAVMLTNFANAFSNFSASTAGGNVSLANTIVLMLGASNLGTGRLTISNNGQFVEQSGALTAGGFTANNTGRVRLNNGGNAIAALSVSPSALDNQGSVALTNTRDIDLGTINMGSSLLSLTIDGAVTQSGPMRAAELSIFSTGAATLTNSGNAINILQLRPGANFSGTSSVSLTNTRLLTVSGTFAQNSTLTINNGANAITQSSSLIGGSLVLVTSGSAGIALNNGANAISSFTATTGGGNVSLTNSRALTLGASNLGTGTLTISNGANAIGQSGALTAGGINVTTSNAGLTLTNAANAISNFSASTLGGNVSLVNAAELTLGASNLGAGMLTISNSANAIGQSGGLTAGGINVTTSNAAVTLTNAANAFSNFSATTAGGNVSLANTIFLMLGASNLGTGRLTISNNGQFVEQSGALTAGGFTANNTGRVRLNNGGNAIAALSVSPSALDNQGGVSLTNTRDIDLGTINMGSSLLSLDIDGAVTQSGAIWAAELSIFSTGAATLTNSGNFINILQLRPGANFSGTSSVSLTNSRLLTVSGTFAQNSTLTINNGANAITQSSSLIGGSLVLVTSGSAGIALNNGANAISSFTATTGGGNVSLTNSRALTLGASNLGTGTLTISNGANAIGQSGALTAGGINVTTSNAGLTLTNLSNAISNFSATTGGGNVSLVNTAALTLGASNLGAGMLTINNSGRSVNQSGALTAGGVTASNISSLNLGQFDNAIASLAAPTGMNGSTVTLRNTSALDLGTINLGSAGLLWLIGSGNVTQSGPITTDNARISGIQPIVLTNSANAIRSLVLAGGNVTLTNTVALGVSGDFSTLTLNNGGNAVTQPTGFSGRLFGGGLTLVNSTNVALNNIENGFASLTTTVTGGSINVANSRALTLGASSLGAATLTISTGANAITQSGAVTGGTLNITTSNAGVTLTNPSNAIGTFSTTTTAGNVSLVNAGALTLGASSLGTGTMTVNNGANAVTQSGAIAGGTLNITTSNAGVTLTNLSNAISNFTATTAGGNVSLVNNSALTLGASNLGTGTLTIESRSSVQQSGALIAAGVTARNFTWLNLADSGNSIASLTIPAASSLAIALLRNTRDLDLGTINLGSSGTLDLRSVSGNVTQSGPITTDLVMTSRTATLTNSANAIRRLELGGGNMALTNTVPLAVSGVFSSLTLNNGGNAVTQPTGFSGRVFGSNLTLVNSTNVTLNNSENGISQLTTTVTSGSISLTNRQTLTLGTSSLGTATLTISTGANAVTQSGAVTGGTVNIVTSNAGVTLTNPSNTIGTFSANTAGGNVSLINTRALTLGASNLSTGTLTISNGANAIGQSGAIAGGTLNITTSNAGVTLTNLSNAISNFSATTAGGSVSLVNTAALTLGASNLGTGALTVSNGVAAVGQTGPLTAGGVNVTTSNAGVTLNNSANAINSFATTTGGGNVSLINTSGLTLGTSSLGTGRLTIGNTGDITLANGSTLGSMAGGDAIVLQTGGRFLSPGSGAIDTPQGRFLVFAADPSRLEIAGPLTARTAYGLSAAAYNAGTAVGPAGIRFVFANTPTGLITLTSASRVFDGTAQGLTAFTIATNGGSRFDDASEVLVGTPISQTATDVRRSGGSPTGAVLAYDIGIANLASLTSPIGYQLVGGTGQLTITPRTLVLTPLATTRVYGESNPLTNGFTVELLNGVGNALVGSDALAPTIRIASDAAATAAAGSAFDLTGIGAQFTSGNAGNYRILYDVLAGGLTITPRPITIAADAQTRVYGNANPALSLAVGGMGLVNGDMLTGALATTADVRSNVGNYAITRGTLAASANYNITGFTSADLTVTQRPLTITYAAAPTTMIYGDAVPVLGGSFASIGLVNDDTLSGALQFATAATPASNVGLYGIIGSGLGASDNYSLTVVQAPGNATALAITPAPLTVTVLAGQGKIYGDDDPALVFGTVGLKNDDTVGSAMTGAIARAAGEDVTAGGYDISQGTLAANANYRLDFASDLFRITPASLTVTADALRRTYGDADPALTFNVAGLKRADSAASVLTGALVRAPGNNVGSYAISQGSLALASGNYSLDFAGNNLTIDPAVLTFTANAASRVYGNSNPRFTGTLTGFVNGETRLTATTGTMVFATAATAATDVGSHAISGGGLSAQNYVFAQAASNDAALTITPRPLAVAASARTRVYGDANPALTWRATGLVNGDRLSGALATDATVLSDVGSYVITQGTLMASANYILSFTGAQLTINPRPITIRPNTISRVYGNENPTLTYRIGGRGMANGDTLTGALATDANPQSNVGSYAITQGTLAASTNYVLTMLAGTLKVTPRPITITAISRSRVYGDVNPAFGFTVGGSGLVNGDTLTGELATAAIETSNIGRYAITLGTLAATTNYTLRYVGGTLTVTARPITVFADPQSRVFGTANPPLTYTVGGRGLVNGDVLTGALATTATPTSRIGSYAISRGTLTGGSNYLMTYFGSTLTVTPTSPPPP